MRTMAGFFFFYQEVFKCGYMYKLNNPVTFSGEPMGSEELLTRWQGFRYYYR